jgi:GNAT superfamily N-acetyltransferase
VQQLEGLFDLPPATSAVRSWDVNLPIDERDWHVGVIVGPSGSGKTTVARALFGEWLGASPLPWPEDEAIIDAFPEEMSLKDIARLLGDVGLSTPTAWLRPYRVQSTGERFRADLARLLAGPAEMVVVDEYTSVVDRTVARVASAALAKAVRRLGKRFVAVTCHEDVLEWLQPDWVYRPETNEFCWRCLQRRPAIELRIQRSGLSLWPLFRPHHYLSGEICHGAQAFVAYWDGKLVGFSAWVNNLVRHGGKREHRTVVLPDYQGIGIGTALANFCGALWKGLGRRVLSTTTHPGVIAARLRSDQWRLIRRPSLVGRSNRRSRRIEHARTRLTAGFAYSGPALERSVAERMLKWKRNGEDGEIIAIDSRG